MGFPEVNSRTRPYSLRVSSDAASKRQAQQNNSHDECRPSIGSSLAAPFAASHDKQRLNMAQLDWSQCAAVESIPGKVSGAWLLKGTRMPVSVIFENLEAGMSVKEITEVFDVTED